MDSGSIKASAGSTGDRRLAAVTIAANVVFLIIGLRFIFTPDDAAETFGIDPVAGQPGFLHAVIGLRDLWLAGLMIALTLLRERRALAIALALGVLVCFADAVIAMRAAAEAMPMAFHIGSGLFFAFLAWSWARPMTNP